MQINSGSFNPYGCDNNPQKWVNPQGLIAIAIKRGQAPKGIVRVDSGREKGQQDHIHFDDGSALN